MERTTRKQLESMVANLDGAMRDRGYDGAHLALGVRSADYPYRYCVSSEDGSTYPLGERYATAGDLWDALRLALRAVQALPVQVTT